MLSFALLDFDGNRKTLDKVFSVVYNSNSDVPADELTVTFLYDKGLIENADMIYAFWGDRVAFKGQIDEIINLFSAEKIVTKIVARSLASGLLDNEAEPVTYYNPTADFIFEKHLSPFGIREFEASKKPFYGSLKINKGMTNWQVFENFCKSRYGNIPRITADGKAYFEGCNKEQKAVFGFGKNEIHFCSYRENIKRYSLVSDVKVKLDEFGSYDTHIVNKNPDCRGIKRTRYVNAVTDKTSLATADKIIENSNAKSYSVALQCLGCYLDLTGAKAKINDNTFGRIENLVVKGVNYVFENNCEYTTVTLGKDSNYQ